jgi:uncharacterized protein
MTVGLNSIGKRSRARTRRRTTVIAKYRRFAVGLGQITAAEIFANASSRGSMIARTAASLRFIALGRVEMEICRVAYTWRGESVIRIVTAQKTSKYERETYHREIFA